MWLESASSHIKLNFSCNMPIEPKGTSVFGEVTMATAALSIAGFSAYVASSSNISASQQAFQSLQQALASGNLTAAQTAFTKYQSLTANLAQTSGSSSNSQLTTDLTALGTAISSGNLTSAQSAFATVQNDLKSTTSPSVAAAENAVAQTVSEVQDLLSIFSSSSSSTTSTDPTTQILDSAYGGGSSSSTSGVNVYA